MTRLSVEDDKPVDGEWVTEFCCASCGTPTDPDEAVCSLCGPTKVTRHREWICHRHGNACFCWPEEAGTDEVPFL